MTSFHTRAAIISIGDEIVLGQSLDTNSKWLSDQLLRVGVASVEHVTVGDTLDDIVASFQRLAGRVDLVVSTGGLGPTLDDLTRQALAKLLGEELVMDHAALDAIRIGLEKGGRKMSDAQKIQATRPHDPQRVRHGPRASGDGERGRRSGCGHLLPSRSAR
jgi:nicotinamide-nucleotide amidase